MSSSESRAGDPDSSEIVADIALSALTKDLDSMFTASEDNFQREKDNQDHSQLNLQKTELSVESNDGNFNEQSNNEPTGLVTSQLSEKVGVEDSQTLSTSKANLKNDIEKEAGVDVSINDNSSSETTLKPEQTIKRESAVTETGEASGQQNKELRSIQPTESVDSSDDSDEEEEEDDPPILMYSRLNQLPPNLFKSDAVSTATFHENVFIFGTHSGSIHLCNPDFSAIRTFKAHRASVLSLYTDGIFFSSGSMDGTIVIGAVNDARDIVMFDYKRPIHAVVLDRNYQRTRSFVCGGMSGKVIYSSKNWLDQRVDVNLDEGHGPIICIQAIDDLILWMNDQGITVYHVPARQVISVIEKPSDSFRSDLYWPRVSFPETDRVLIAWGNYIWSLRVSVKGPLSGNAGAGSSVKSRLLPSAASLSFRTSVPEKNVVVEHVYKVDFLISGIATFADDQWIVLAYNPPQKDEKTGNVQPLNPDLRLLRALDGVTIHDEEIGFDSAESLGLNDYFLGYHIGASSTRYFIVSARGGVVAQQIQLGDRLQWYLDRDLYYKAWSMSKYLVKPIERLNYGVEHLDQLVKLDKWEEAASWMAELLYLDSKEFPIGDTKSTLGTRVSSALQLEENEQIVKEIGNQWNQWCEIFIKSGHEKELTKVIPKDSRWSLQKSFYSSVLQYWLSCLSETELAYDLLKEWDIELYDVDTVTSTIELILELHPDNLVLRKILCDIYENSLSPAKVVPHLCFLRDPLIIQFLDQNHILTSFITSIPNFIKLRFKKDDDIQRLSVNQIRNVLKDIIAILVQKRFEIVPQRVVELMATNHVEVVSYLYLEQLAAIDDLLVRDLEDVRIELYCQFDRPKLLPFLTNHKRFNIAKAIELCEVSALVDELIYLLGQTGENKKALKLIMEELDDPQRAIKFAKAQNDQDTWNILLDFSYSRPTYIKALIELCDDQSSRFYNPITILQNMSTEVDIDGLKESFTRVALDNDLNVVVNQLVLRIVYKRSEELSQQLNSDMLRGMQFASDSPELKKISDLFETFVITLTGRNSLPVIGLVSSVVQNDKFAYRLSTDLASKLKHIKFLNEMHECIEVTENISAQ
ncbi:hypothetical protein PUMCH_001247 [Australozyma saopauloensis]|uniref:Vacuolar protein sorting-associated protein 41 n=1 Tax=Australozyma saopauloensis TaxID=291208 RepID=A0AAX4H651_9ASCO|nr:hypothetical protein PUMCH_001247 [[Candida] saopauloensis]